MPTDATALLRFAEKCYKMPATLEGVAKGGLADAALLTKKAVLESAKAHGWPTNGKRAVKANYQLTPSIAFVQLVGGFSYMFEGGAKPHSEPRATGKKAGHKINIPGVGVFDHIQHPGFRGRGFWTEGITAATPLIGKAYGDSLIAGMRKVF